MPYVVELKLPLPAVPLQSGHPIPDRRSIPSRLLAPAEFATEAEARRHALTIQDYGYGATITDPDGNQHLVLPH